jgi:hypothetical protein
VDVCCAWLMGFIFLLFTAYHEWVFLALFLNEEPPVTPGPSGLPGSHMLAANPPLACGKAAG